jgi:hypothetical protein
LIFAIIVYRKSEDLMAGVLLLVGLFIFYFLPSFIASSRKHHNMNSIAVINLFLGWTFLGWVICLAWSFSEVKRRRFKK